MDKSNDTAEDISQQQGQNLQRQQQRRQSPSLKAARPYRRRIKPPPTKVHHVHPARFRRFVQSRTCLLLDSLIDASAASTIAAAPEQQSVPAHQLACSSSAGATHGGDQPPTASAGRLSVIASPRSMQEAYIAWCSSDHIPLSPGTMAELSFTMPLPNAAPPTATSTPRGSG